MDQSLVKKKSVCEFAYVMISPQQLFACGGLSRAGIQKITHETDFLKLLR